LTSTRVDVPIQPVVVVVVVVLLSIFKWCDGVCGTCVHILIVGSRMSTRGGGVNR
jgi:hypothetical protein